MTQFDKTAEAATRQATELIKQRLRAGVRGRHVAKAGAVLAGSFLTYKYLKSDYSVFAVVPAGHVGVLDRFGVVQPTVLHPGFSWKSPLEKCIRISTKTQLEDYSCTAPSKEGLSVTMAVSVLFRLEPESAAKVYKTIGPQYLDIVFRPQLRSAIRDITSAHDAKDLYSSSMRTSMTLAVEQSLRASLSSRGIQVEEVRFRDLTLPARLTQAIEEKLRAEQGAMQMHFVLERERAEAERKAIEAEGIARFQKIVAEGVSQNLLRWKGIEATERLAMSPNAKVVVVGGKDGLPLILGQ
ncbi:membrane protease subunit [Fimicolochytrium jonesii]|uniref:membrane protease subunit n=1 Tax=Fimicolochytrium jonesii TaxID=1396493 RepID=UPI0022FEEA5D|nr:membrane protease subunit [Fimicolochytrium jonesii]KAI8826532.1 membrane protease subunit [Fimicolochytrium jonesii]